MRKSEERSAGQILPMRLFNELGLLGPLQGLDHIVFVALAGGDQHFVLEFPAQHGCYLQDALLASTQFTQPRLDGHLDALGNLQRRHFRPVPAAVLVIQVAAFDQGLADFLDEEGIALGLLVDAIQKLGRDLFVEQGRQQVTGLVLV